MEEPERRRDVREMKGEIELLREVARATNALNGRLVAALRWNAITTAITIIVFLAVALVAMWR